MIFGRKKHKLHHMWVLVKPVGALLEGVLAHTSQGAWDQAVDWTYGTLDDLALRARLKVDLRSQGWRAMPVTIRVEVRP